MPFVFIFGDAYWSSRFLIIGMKNKIVLSEVAKKVTESINSNAQTQTRGKPEVKNKSTFTIKEEKIEAKTSFDFIGLSTLLDISASSINSQRKTDLSYKNQSKLDTQSEVDDMKRKLADVLGRPLQLYYDSNLRAPVASSTKQAYKRQAKQLQKLRHEAIQHKINQLGKKLKIVIARLVMKQLEKFQSILAFKQKKRAATVAAYFLCWKQQISILSKKALLQEMIRKRIQI